MTVQYGMHLGSMGILVENLRSAVRSIERELTTLDEEAARLAPADPAMPPPPTRARTTNGRGRFDCGLLGALAALIAVVVNVIQLVMQTTQDMDAVQRRLTVAIPEWSRGSK